MRPPAFHPVREPPVDAFLRGSYSRTAHMGPASTGLSSTAGLGASPRRHAGLRAAYKKPLSFLIARASSRIAAIRPYSSSTINPRRRGDEQGLDIPSMIRDFGAYEVVLRTCKTRGLD